MQQRTLRIVDKEGLQRLMTVLSAVNSYCAIEPVRRVLDETLSKLVEIDDHVDSDRVFDMSEDA